MPNWRRLMCHRELLPPIATLMATLPWQPVQESTRQTWDMYWIYQSGWKNLKFVVDRWYSIYIPSINPHHDGDEGWRCLILRALFTTNMCTAQWILTHRNRPQHAAASKDKPLVALRSPIVRAVSLVSRRRWGLASTLWSTYSTFSAAQNNCGSGIQQARRHIDNVSRAKLHIFHGIGHLWHNCINVTRTWYVNEAVFACTQCSSRQGWASMAGERAPTIVLAS